MLHILLLEDDFADSELVRAIIKNGELNCELKWVTNRRDFLIEIEKNKRYELRLHII